MKKLLSLALTLTCIHFSSAQSPQTYQNSRDETHLCGLIQIEDLQKGEYQSWFEESYSSFSLEDQAKWKKQLKNKEVEIYLGTWCGDSRNWVPKFISLWDQLGLDRSQLKLISLFDGQEKYKQGPNGEEVGKNIHRVPTFIFKADGQEYARIVESPANDMVTDLAQIALGYPSNPNYRAATYLQELMAAETIEEIRVEIKKHARAAYYKTHSPNELNTLGYVLLRAHAIEKALLVFEINTYLFPSIANTFDSYAEALTEAGRIDEAIKYYGKVLELDQDNEHAQKQVDKLKAG